MFKIIKNLKNTTFIQKVSSISKKAYNFLLRFRNRDLINVFHSPKTSISKAGRPGSFNPDFLHKNPVKGVSFFKDVYSYPLKTGLVKDYSGGLVNIDSGLLINEAVHLGDKGQPTQELPAELITGDHFPEIQQPVIFGGILFNHFGHFMLESLGRIWAYDYYRDLDPFILFYNVSPNQDYLEKNNFIYQVFSGFNISHKKILFIDHPVKIKYLLVPEQKYGYTHRLNPDDIFLKFVRSFQVKTAIPKHFENAGKIYVSRSKIKIGKPVGEKFFEVYLRSEGYSILHPEDHTLFEQLHIYKNASKIIFCDGAALHACVLLPDLQAQVAVIARRRDPRWDGRNIIDQFDGYSKYVLWIDDVKYQYQFGLESWHALSVIDWFNVSVKLKNGMFVERLGTIFNEMDISTLLRTELYYFITNIRHLPGYLAYMIQLKETIPIPENDKSSVT